uniref:C2H2-type domain-containing protein n=1 Tax=Dendroctonus ponderosae TaxID=77166 RepID=A0AAR5Q704_DENPD
MNKIRSTMEQTEIEVISSTQSKSENIGSFGEHGNAADSATLPNNSHTNSGFDLPSFNCSECSYNSIWKHAVKRHQRTHFRKEKYAKSGKKVKLACTHCMYTSDNWADFLDHQTSHITSEDGNLRFNLEHKHDEEDDDDDDDDDDDEQKLIIACPYKCDKCQFESLDKSTFEEHKNATHGTTLKCPHCSYISRKKNALSKHIRTAHQEIPSEPSSEKAAVPTKVDGTKGSKRPYRRGIYAHVPVKTTGNGLFECEHCSYQTAIRTALVKHQTKHSKV